MLSQPSLPDSSPNLEMESVFLKPLMAGIGDRMLILCFTHSGRCGTSGGSWAPAGWGQQGLSVGFAESGAAVSLFLSNEVSCCSRKRERSVPAWGSGRAIT